MTTDLDKQWRVQWRLSRNWAWQNGGLHETRKSARESAINDYRIGRGVGLYNTRVLLYVKPKV